MHLLLGDNKVKRIKMINLSKIYEEKGPCANRKQQEEVYLSLASPKRSPKEMALELRCELSLGWEKAEGTFQAKGTL